MSGGASSSGVSNPVGLEISNATVIDVEKFPMLEALPCFLEERCRDTEDNNEPRPRQVAFGGSGFSVRVEYPLVGRKASALHGLRVGRGRHGNEQVPFPGYRFTGSGLSMRRVSLQLLCSWLSRNDSTGTTR
ncbi:unnamed protein product [Ascophyllum nodosum]